MPAAARAPQPATSPPRRRTVSRRDERRELQAWLAGYVRDQVTAALRREAARLADAIGKALAEERAQFRKINDALIARLEILEQRAAPDSSPAAVLDLSDERRRRAGEK